MKLILAKNQPHWQEGNVWPFRTSNLLCREVSWRPCDSFYTYITNKYCRPTCINTKCEWTCPKWAWVLCKLQIKSPTKLQLSLNQRPMHPDSERRTEIVILEMLIFSVEYLSECYLPQSVIQQELNSPGNSIVCIFSK